MAETVDGGPGVASHKQAEGREPLFHGGPSFDALAPLAALTSVACCDSCTQISRIFLELSLTTSFPLGFGKSCLV